MSGLCQGDAHNQCIAASLGWVCGFLWGAVVPRFLGFVVRRSCVVSHELCCRGYWKVATTAKVVQKVRGVSFCCDGRGEMCFSRATPSRLHLCCHKQLNCCFRLSMCRFFILRLFSIVVLESRIRLFDLEGSACEARRNAIEVDECVGLAL